MTFVPKSIRAPTPMTGVMQSTVRLKDRGRSVWIHSVDRHQGVLVVNPNRLFSAGYTGLSVAMTVLVGCHAYPTKPWSTNTELTGAAKDHESEPVTTPREAKVLIDGLVALLDDARKKRETASRVVDEVIFYGTFVAVAGIAFDSIAARNIGAGVAGSGALIGGHYHFDNQEAALARATGRALCLQQAMGKINLDSRNLFPADFDDGDLRTAWDAMPQNTVSAIASIGRQLDTDLRAIDMTTSGLDAVSKLGQSYHEAAEKEARKPTPGPTGATKTILDAQERQLNAQITAAARAVTPAVAPGPGAPAAAQVVQLLSAAQLAELKRTVARLRIQAANEADARRVFRSRVLLYGTDAEGCVVVGASK
jgi:hypothetical protein